MKNSFLIEIAILVALALIAAVIAIRLQRHHEPEQPRHEPHQPARKLKLVYVRGTHCPACDKMERQTFANPKVAEALAAFDVAHVSGKDAEKRYGVNVFPTYILFTPDEREVKRGTGYRSPEEFLTWLTSHQEARAGCCCGLDCQCVTGCKCP